MFALLILPTLLLTFLGLAGMYALRWRDCRLTDAPAPAATSDGAAAGISVVVAVKHLSPQTETCVAELMKQEYADFEVIVVEECPQKDSKDEWERLQRTFPGLRHSAVPASSRYIGRRMMALTLGFRAAHKPWVVIAEADATPASPHWLATLAAHFDAETRIVTAYSNYADDGSRRARRAIGERLMRQLHAHHAAAHAGAIGTEDANVAIRKDFFLACGGFQHSLRLPFGCVPLFVSRYGTTENTRSVLLPEATLLQDFPHPAQLRARRIESAEVQRRSPRPAGRYALRNAAATASTYLVVAAAIAHVAFRILDCCMNLALPFLMQATVPTAHPVPIAAATPSEVYPPVNLAFDIPLLLCLAAALLLPYLLLRKATTRLGERQFGAFTLLWYALASPFRTLSRRIACLRLRSHWTRPTHPAVPE